MLVSEVLSQSKEQGYSAKSATFSIGRTPNQSERFGDVLGIGFA
jgi:hypothetical protein